MKRVLRKLAAFARSGTTGGRIGPARVAGPRSQAGPADGTGSTVFGFPGVPLKRVEPVDPSAWRSDLEADTGTFKIRLARSRTLSRDASVLVERRYAWRGYEVRGQARDQNLRTFVAYRDGNVAGTLSVRVDGGDGLSADRHYRHELDKLRATGARLSEFTRLAVDDKAASTTILGTLIHTGFMYLYTVRNCKFAVFEVNPRHVDYYKRWFFCEPLGPQRMNDRVKAPSVLLCMTLEKVAREADRLFAAPDRLRKSRSPLAKWFPPDEAAGVLARLQALDKR